MSWKLLFVPLLLTTGVVLADDVPQAEPGAGATKAKDQTSPADDKADNGDGAGEAKEQTSKADNDAGNGTGTSDKQATTEEGDKLISGMSILGNQEAPKSLVIVPWKSSQIGDSLGITTMLDDSRQPVDKEVFLRALSYYEIRSNK